MRTTGEPVNPLSAVYPGFDERAFSAYPAYGQMVVVSAPIGPPLLVDGVTYKHAIFCAPCNGCRIVSGWFAQAVVLGGGTNTFDVSNYDKSASTARAVITQLDPGGGTAKEGEELTLSTTTSYLSMDKGDVLNVTLVCGTMTTDGQGFVVTFVIWVPNPTIA